jgi:hypothetical protein
MFSGYHVCLTAEGGNFQHFVTQIINVNSVSGFHVMLGHSVLCVSVKVLQ